MSAVTAPLSSAAVSSGPVSSAASAPIAPARLAQIRKTAQQFEAIFVRQMLSAARKSSPGDAIAGGPDGDDAGAGSQGSDTFMDMEDAKFADIASQKGAFGLGAMIEKQLIAQQRRTAGHAPVPSAPAAQTSGAPAARISGSGG